MFTINVVDSTDGWLEKCGISYPYLQSRAQKALDSMLPGQFKVAKVGLGRITQADIVSLQADSSLLLVAIVRKGQQAMLSELLKAMGAKALSENKELLAAVCNGTRTERGFAEGRLAFVGTSEASVLPDSDDANRKFVSNILIHEIGHMVLTVLTGRSDADRDHGTQGVMRAGISTTDSELNYSGAFKNITQVKADGTHKRRR